MTKKHVNFSKIQRVNLRLHNVLVYGPTNSQLTKKNVKKIWTIDNSMKQLNDVQQYTQLG